MGWILNLKDEDVTASSDDGLVKVLGADLCRACLWTAFGEMRSVIAICMSLLHFIQRLNIEIEYQAAHLRHLSVSVLIL